MGTPRVHSVATHRGHARNPQAEVQGQGLSVVHGAVLDQARRAGLLDGDKSEHVGFRVPPALLEAAKREAGVSSTSELGILALAMLASPDPVASFFRRTEGQLGPSHDLKY